MRAIYQTKLSHVDGNCLPACIASILDLELDEVPEIEDRSSNWLSSYSKILYNKGIHIAMSGSPPPIDEPYIACIITKYNQYTQAYSLYNPIVAHAVVCQGKNSRIIHNPVPSTKFEIPRIDDHYFLEVKKVNK